jgi:integrase/recombinase XerD
MSIRTASTLKYLDLFHVHLAAKAYSLATIRQYASLLGNFLDVFAVSPVNIGADEIVRYISLLKSSSHKAQCRGALQNFYVHVIGQSKKFDRVPHPKKEHHLPVIMDQDDLVANLRAIPNIKHRAMLSLLYSAGLRRQELLDLRIKDIDGKRGMLFIRQSKGAKDRSVPISTNMLVLLRSYFTDYRPSLFLFNGAAGRAYSATSLGKICEKYLGCNPHLLRHCHATHLAEMGLELGTLSKRLGHTSIKTTMIYHHVMKERNPKLIHI